MNERVESVDLLRGVVMVLMALDHTRDFFGDAGVNPTNPATTTAALFFTRWITHVCAPTFFLLTGTGASLARRRRSRAELSRFLLTRGLSLIAMEFAIARAGLQFNVDYRVTLLTVMWALGWSMIALAALVHLPAPAVTAIGVMLIATHNLADPVRASAFGALAPIWSLLHAPNVVFDDSQHVVFAAYPLIPWIGVTAAGYGLGEIYRWEAARRQRVLLTLGVALTAAFVFLRAVNVYGDPVRWSAHASTAKTALSFLNATKYPPSLLFLLMTLGPALLFLRAVDARTPALLRPALVIGKVPLFYFLLHMPLIHLLAVISCYARYGHGQLHWIFESPTLAQYPITQPPGWPLGLPAVYAIWIAVVVLMYPLCQWYAGVKRRQPHPALSYL